MLQRTPVFSRAGGLLCVLGVTFSLVTTASSAAEDQVARETARPLLVDPSIPPQKDLPPVAVTLRKMSKTHEGPADVSAKSSLLSGAIPPAGGACDLECDFCWCGTEFENNCPNDWRLDADCDCGCQFCDAGCADCELQDCVCGPECLFCWIDTPSENNCPLSWCGDSECDCGCQFTDSDCPGGTCGCNSVCGNGICECECDETVDTCSSDCIAVPCAAESAIELGVGEEYGLAGEMCFETIASCPCEAACEFCNDGNCDPAWNGDGECDCGCQFCDIDCVGVVDCCIPGPSPAEVCVQVFSPALGSVSCPEPLTCIGDDPTCGTSVLDPGTGRYLFCPTYTSADVGEACVRLWIEGPDSSCDPELWWRFNQVCSCGNGFCEAGCGEDFASCPNDCPGPKCTMADLTGGVFADANPIARLVLDQPGHCSIDARQPHDINEVAVRFGWDRVVLSFSCDPAAIGMDTGDFTVSVVPAGAAPGVANVVIDSVGNTATVMLDAMITPGHWTCIAHPGSANQWCMGYLPADASQDGLSASSDINALIDSINLVPGRILPMYATDCNRSGVTTGADILRLIDLLNGAGDFDRWITESLPPCPSR